MTDEEIEWAKRQARSVGRRWPSVPLEELEQEAQIALWKVMRHYDPAKNDNWQGFAFKYVHQVLRKRCEKWRRWTSRNNPGADLSRVILEDGRRDLDLSVSERRARAVFHTLGTKYQWVVEEHMFHGRTFEDIAEDAAVSAAYINQLYSRAVVAMRKLSRYSGLECSTEPKRKTKSEPSAIMPLFANLP